MGLTVCLTLKGVRSPDLVCTTNHVKADACGSHAAVVLYSTSQASLAVCRHILSQLEVECGSCGDRGQAKDSCPSTDHVFRHTDREMQVICEVESQPGVIYIFWMFVHVPRQIVCTGPGELSVNAKPGRAIQESHIQCCYNNHEYTSKLVQT